MTLSLARTFPRTLDALLARFEDMPGLRLEAWLFEGEAARREGEAKLAEKGVEACLRSAYKPLVHAFLEEIDLTGARSVHIAYPVHREAEERRFLLEAYPLAGLVDIPLSFSPRQDDALRYDVTLTGQDGSARIVAVEAPNRVHVDHTGVRVLSPTGWLRTFRDGAPVEDARLETEFEALFETAVSAIAGHDWGVAEPFFEELRIEASLPVPDRPLAIGEEAVSLTEALHEDLYFSGLEIFQARSGRPSGDRGLQPGRIVPDIGFSEGPASLRISLRPHEREEEPAAPSQPLDEASEPLSVADVEAALHALGGEALGGRSVCGRAVAGRYREGPDALVLVSGGQHANEPTGVVGALRAARVLADRDGAHFAVLPLENPDGYALCARLRRTQPRHMHHAARYTALGDDLEYRQGMQLHERSAREALVERARPGLHVNLHGYPAHEWTRPLTGYVPRNFALWTVPKGFFLVLRHHPGFGEESWRLARAVTARLAEVPGLLALNEQQIALYRIHAGELGFEIMSGFPVTVVEDTRHAVPVTLITEYPDETIYGEAFRLGHEAQMRTVLAAYEAWQAIAPRD
ncbi:peptidase M14 [Aureimonas populi]|uniref:Peptidase M14 n=1 Tax=Aureimonas populi TaxID=1701758 RepID=A0ABW5CL96_9HYPH|nr:peptidase M14 [Aureimonas populi]